MTRTRTTIKATTVTDKNLGTYIIDINPTPKDITSDSILII